MNILKETTHVSQVPCWKSREQVPELSWGDSAWYDKEHCPLPPKTSSWSGCPLLLKRDRDSHVATGTPLPTHLFL